MNFFLEGDIFVNLYTFLILHAKMFLADIKTREAAVCNRVINTPCFSKGGCTTPAALSTVGSSGSYTLHCSILFSC